MSAARQPLRIPRDAAPWVRYGARLIDTWTFLGLPLYLSLPRFAPGVAEDPLGRDLAYSFALLVYTLVEAVLLATWGTTPGKWVLNMRVTDEHGRPLPFGRAWRRAFTVYWRGMGAGLRLFMLIGQFVGYKALEKTGTTAWDQQTQAMVVHGPVGKVRTIAALVILFGPYVYMIAGSLI